MAVYWETAKETVAGMWGEGEPALMEEWKANVVYQFTSGQYAIHLAKVGTKALYVAQPLEIVLHQAKDGVETSPMMYLASAAARSLYDALGVALNVHTPDARMAAEVLKIEQARVEKLIDYAISTP